MGNGIVPVNAKPISASAALADFFVTVINGKVRLATIKTIVDCLNKAQIADLAEAVKEAERAAIRAEEGAETVYEALAAADRAEAAAGIAAKYAENVKSALFVVTASTDADCSVITNVSATYEQMRSVLEKNGMVFLTAIYDSVYSVFVVTNITNDKISMCCIKGDGDDTYAVRMATVDSENAWSVINYGSGLDADMLNQAISNALAPYALKNDLPEVPVKSVNGKTGEVSLNATDVGARPSTWTPSASDVGADLAGTAANQVSSHNTNTAAHSDIRLLISELSNRLNAIANSEDVDLDQMAELVAYIKDNRELIEQITTGKVSVTDIVNDLVTNVSTRPLSAAQGVALKALIDAIPSWAKNATKPSYTASEVGADPSGTASGAVSAHNTDTAAHDDIRQEISALSQKNAELENDISTLSLEKVSKTALTLGIQDGLIYLFVDGAAVGTGIEQGSSGDLVGYIDENNNIILTGTVPEGATYSVKYEMEDGTFINIGDLTLSTDENGDTVVEIINQIPISTDADGNPFNNGQGWKTGYRISGSSGGESAQTGTEVTGFIPFKYGDAVYMKNIVDDGTHVVGFYTETYSAVCTYSINNIFGGAVNGEIAEATTDIFLDNHTDKLSIRFMRLSATEITDDSIITVNEPIE